jgi:UDP-GlcNAc:undecaprenyl-phosphate GlcNAc-1-phosphate transferase
MTTLIAAFLLSLILSLLLTPLVAKAARKYGIMDMPSDRKVHRTPIPRAGGLAVYLSFYLAFVPMLLLGTRLLDFLYEDVRLIYVVAGGVVIFVLGLIDDIRGIRPNTKLLVQVFAALVAYAGGIQIHAVQIPMMPVIDMGLLSIPATVLWVLLVVNAVNLIDGLDGLASGVAFFVSMVLIILCVLSGRMEVAILLTVLAGSILGFLRYNFNPASIFLGDSGSYFLGYMLATLSMLGSIKGHAAVAILIPMIALGIPLMDTIWSSVRRFIRGQRIFKPDRDHFHHRLLKIGYSHRRAVIILYGVTVFMGVISLLMVHSRDDRSALLLLLVGAMIVFGIRKLGYLEYLAMDKLLGWVNDITDDFGFKRDRRTFLARQIEIARSETLDEFWRKLVDAAEYLNLDYMELNIGPRDFYDEPVEKFVWKSGKWKSLDLSSIDPRRTMFVSLPLEYRSFQFGTLVVSKTLGAPYQISTQILRRIEHLRRTSVETISRISMRKGIHLLKNTAPPQQQTLPFEGPSMMRPEFHPDGTPADGYKANGHGNGKKRWLRKSAERPPLH